jgi:hypothetical protein
MNGIGLRLWGSSLDFWFRPQGIAALRLYERLLCLSMLYYFSGYLRTGELWLTATGFHVSPKATSGHYIPPPPLIDPHWIQPAVICFYICCAVYLIGWARRPIAVLFFGLAVYVQAMDQPSAFTINRLLIVYFLFLALQPQEVMINGKRHIPGWIIRFFQLTLVVQYFCAGICKINPGDWLLSFDVIWTQAQGHYKNSVAAWAVNSLPLFCWHGFAVFTLVFECLAPILFFWKRTRWLAIISGLLLHIGIALLMKDLIYFSLQMVVSYVFFIRPDEIASFKSRLLDLGTSAVSNLRMKQDHR